MSDYLYHLLDMASSLSPHVPTSYMVWSPYHTAATLITVAILAVSRMITRKRPLGFARAEQRPSTSNEDVQLTELRHDLAAMTKTVCEVKQAMAQQASQAEMQMKALLDSQAVMMSLLLDGFGHTDNSDSASVSSSGSTAVSAAEYRSVKPIKKARSLPAIPETDSFHCLLSSLPAQEPLPALAPVAPAQCIPSAATSAIPVQAPQVINAASPLLQTSTLPTVPEPPRVSAHSPPPMITPPSPSSQSVPASPLSRASPKTVDAMACWRLRAPVQRPQQTPLVFSTNPFEKSSSLITTTEA